VAHGWHIWARRLRSAPQSLYPSPRLSYFMVTLQRVDIMPRSSNDPGTKRGLSKIFNGTSWLGMAIRVLVSGHPRVFDPPGVGAVLHPRVKSTPDPHQTRFRFCFTLVDDESPKKTPRQEPIQEGGFGPAHQPFSRNRPTP
jgi:hypothetical protein